VKEPLVFISHAAKDVRCVLSIENYIQHTLEGVKTFVASNPQAISNGVVWSDFILEQLGSAEALIVMLSQNSVARLWVWLEVGYFWRKFGGNRIFCLRSPDVELPHQLDNVNCAVTNDGGAIDGVLSELSVQIGRQYERDDVRLDSLIGEIDEGIPRLALFQEFDEWKSHLVGGNWERAIIWNGLEDTHVWTCREDMSFQMEVQREEVDFSMIARWASSVLPETGFRRSNVNLKISGAIVKQVVFYHWETLGYFVPRPDFLPREIRYKNKEHIYCYDVNTLPYLVGLQIAEFGNGESLDKFASLCSILLTDNKA